jgi:hypothetical protein
VPLVSIAMRKPRAWSAGDQRIVDLEHRLAPGQHDEAGLGQVSPNARPRRQRIGIGKRPPPTPSVPDEIGVAEAAYRGRAVLFAARPQIAARETHEDRTRTRIDRPRPGA